MMKQMSSADSRRLCAGQVITCPADAVKELLDNSLDSGASYVEINLKNSGLSSIQVVDDGSGIKPDDFELLCVKHSTSKLSSFKDLETVDTLGFRGEALSSICSLGKVRVVTKTEGDEIGNILEFDSEGKITKKIASPRTRGTTITVTDLFHSLPVRQKYFEKQATANAKKVYTILHSYGLAIPSLKLLVTDTVKGNKKTIINTQPCNTITQKINNLMPARPPVVVTLQPVDSILNEVADEFSIDLRSPLVKEVIEKVEMEGVISPPKEGRANADLQFVSINGRPVESSKLNKILNQTFRSFDPTGESSRYPVFVINLKLPREWVDVNVTPDKRTLMVKHEAILHALIKSSLIELYGRHRHDAIEASKYSMSSSQLTIVPDFEGKDVIAEPATSRGPVLSEPSTSHLPIQRMTSSTASTPSAIDSRNVTLPNPHITLEPSFDPNQRRITEFLEPVIRPPALPDVTLPSPSTSSFAPNANSTVTGAQTFPPGHPLNGKRLPLIDGRRSPSGNLRRDTSREKSWSPSRPFERLSPSSVSPMAAVNPLDIRPSGNGVPSGFTIVREHRRTAGSPPTAEYPGFVSASVALQSRQQPTVTAASKASDATHIPDPVPPRHQGKDNMSETPRKRPRIEQQHDADGGDVSSKIPDRPQVKAQIDLDEIMDNLKMVSDNEDDEESINEEEVRTSRDEFIPPEVVDIPEKDIVQEIRSKVSREDIKSMKVIGQYNRSFILVDLKGDIFIVDQHAADERRNFDYLLENETLENVVLLNPIPMSLAPYEEEVVKENLSVFNKNGFSFDISERKSLGQQLTLTKVPHYGDVILSKSDAEELVNMIFSSPATTDSLRPTRVKELLAMKACKISIKIQDSLSHQEMEELIAGLATTTSPWTCAHGRPTFRFLTRGSFNAGDDTLEFVEEGDSEE